MKLYLSSYRLGNHPDKLQELIGKPDARIAISINAQDSYTDLDRRPVTLERQIKDLEALGFTVDELDLRDYFDNDNLLETMKRYDAVWFSGGNTFILAKAFRQSGFDKVIDELVISGQLIYSGYSAAFCVLAPSLRGVELIDDKDAEADDYKSGEIWDGMGLIDFYPIVHFRSGHHESDDVEQEYRYVLENNIDHKTFADGDVYVVEGKTAQTLR